MVAPGPIVGDVDALLACGAGTDQTAVGVNGRPLEERRGLLPPDAEPDLVERVLQAVDVIGVEAAAKVASGGGIGDALGAERIEELDILAAPFDVLQALALAQRIVSDVED